MDRLKSGVASAFNRRAGGGENAASSTVRLWVLDSGVLLPSTRTDLSRGELTTAFGLTTVSESEVLPSSTRTDLSRGELTTALGLTTVSGSFSLSMDKFLRPRVSSSVRGSGFWAPADRLFVSDDILSPSSNETRVDERDLFLDSAPPLERLLWSVSDLDFRGCDCKSLDFSVRDLSRREDRHADAVICETRSSATSRSGSFIVNVGERERDKLCPYK